MNTFFIVCSYILSFLILSVPTTDFSFYNGIPFQSPFELAFFFAWLGSLCLFISRTNEPKLLTNKLLLSLLTLLIVIKVFALLLPNKVQHSGFSRCYTSENSSKCWFTANNVFKFNDTGEVVPEFNWDSENGVYRWDRNDLSLVHQLKNARVTYRTILKKGGNFRLIHNGNTRLVHPGLDKTFVESDTVFFSISETLVPAVIEVSAPLDKQSKFKIEESTGDTWTELNTPTFKNAFSILINLTLLILFIVFSAHLISTFKPDALELVFTLVVITLTFYSPLIALRVLLPSAYLFSIRRSKPINYANTYLLFLFVISLFVYKFTIGSPIQFRQVGDDPLTHETFSRQILEEKSLRGGEDVFFFQPGFRYYQALVFLFFGENNSFSLAFNLLALFFGSWLVFVLLFKNWALTKLSTLASVALLLILAGPGSYNLIANLSEYVAWIFLLLSTVIILSKARINIKLVLVPLFLSYAALVRPNQMPGLFMVLLFWLYWFSYNSKKGTKYHSLKPVLWSISIFVLMQLFPLMHNAYYGQSFTLLPKSALDQQALVYTLPPSELMHFFSSQKVRDTVYFQIRHMGVLGHLTVPLHWSNRIAFNIILFCYFGALFILGKKKQYLVLVSLTLVAAPFFLIHLFVDTSNYFPRHQIGPYLVLALLVCFSSLIDNNAESQKT